MKFDRLELIAALERDVADNLKWQQAKHDKAVAEFEQARAQWMDRHGDEWARAALAMRAKLRKGQPIRSSDLPPNEVGLRYSAFPLFEKPDPGTFKYEPRGFSGSLIALLKGISEPVVTDTGLTRLGVGSDALNWAVKSLGAYRG